MLAEFQMFVDVQQQSAETSWWLVFPTNDYKEYLNFTEQEASLIFTDVISVVEWLTIRHTWIYPGLCI